MARVKYGSIIRSLNGSVGGATFQNSQGGAILRSKPVIPLSSSPGQQRQRQNMTSLQAAWSALTPAARLKWVQFVAFSSQHIRHDINILISGYNLFLKYQSCRLMYDLPLLESWTYNPLLVYPTVPILLSDGTYLVLYFDYTINISQFFFVLKLSAPQRPSVLYSAHSCRFIKATFQTVPSYLIQDQYSALFGSVPVAGDSIHYSIYFFSTVNPILSAYSSGILTVNSL